MTDLGPISAAFQLLGALLAVAGIAKTWRTHAAGKSFLDPVTTRLQRLWRWLAGVIRRLLRRPRTQIVGAGAAIAASATLRASAIVAWPSLTTLPYADQLAETDRRISVVHEQVQRDGIRLNDLQREIAEAAARLAEQIAASESRVEAQTREVAIGGLRMEALGLFLVTFGTLLGALG